MLLCLGDFGRCASSHASRGTDSSVEEVKFMSEGQLVFAYGSNMDIAQMRERYPDSKDRLDPVVAKAVGVEALLPARYSGHREGGVGSIIRAPGELVWGIVCHIVTSLDLKRLDTREGVFTNAYYRERLVVKTQ